MRANRLTGPNPLPPAFVYLGELLEVGPMAAVFTALWQNQTQNYVAGKFG